MARWTIARRRIWRRGWFPSNLNRHSRSSTQLKKHTRYTSETEDQSIPHNNIVSELENISHSIEPSHAFAEAIKIAPKLDSSNVFIINSCGDSLKDRDIIKDRLGSYIR